MDEEATPSPAEGTLTFGQRLQQGRSIHAALPSLLFALLYALNIYAKVSILGLDSRMLKLMMELEFLVIHSFPFLALFAVLSGTREKQSKCFRWAFWAMLCLYIFMSGKIAGFWGVVVFAGLTLSTYLGFFFRMYTKQAMTELTVRWIFNFAAFILGASLFHLPGGVDKWIYEGRTLYFGMAYFLVLGGLELSGVYQAAWIGKIADNIKPAKP